VATFVFERALATMHEASAIRSEMERLAARVVAESAAAQYVASDGAVSTRVVDAGNGVVVRTSIAATAGERLHLRADVGEQRLEFSFARLAGATPPVFGRALTVAASASAPSDWGATVALPEELPQLGAAARERTALPSWLVADPGVALLRLAGGTDREDFSLRLGGSPDRPFVPPATGVVLVDGNLWIDAAGETLSLGLRRDLTLVVRGNAYIGSSIRVDGCGKLTIVTTGDGGVAFVDRDGNGRWSTGDELRGAEQFFGPMEGAGNVRLGLRPDGRGTLELDVGLVATGLVTVAAERAIVHGPVVMHRGGASIGEGRLEATGRRLPCLRRAALPGFVPVGRPRASPLREARGEPLYPATPAR
jgi:hypothetical protein